MDNNLLRHTVIQTSDEPIDWNPEFWKQRSNWQSDPVGGTNTLLQDFYSTLDTYRRDEKGIGISFRAYRTVLSNSIPPPFVHFKTPNVTASHWAISHHENHAMKEKSDVIPLDLVFRDHTHDEPRMRWIRRCDATWHAWQFVRACAVQCDVKQIGYNRCCREGS